MIDEEEKLIRSFFLPSKVERYVAFVKNPKKRQKFISELAHLSSLNPKFMYSIVPKEHTDSGISALLKKNGASEHCLAISDIKEIDGKKLEIEDAIGTVLGRTFGTFLSCKPGSLAYFENEDGRWILKR
jgi:hypothetical protein